MNQLIRFLKGYVHIRLSSNDPERFLNLCARNGILLWGLVNRNGFYEMYLSVSDFYKLRGLCRKSGSRIKILKKYGISFYFYRNRKRKVFFAGGILFPALIFVLSLFIWNIHVTGNYANSTGTILEFLEEQGISHGVLKSQLNCGKIAAMLREEFPDIIWVSARLEGTQLILDIKENVDGYPESRTEDGPSDLVASKDGIVQSIITRAGTPLVLPGTVCKKGDILVSGEIAVKNDSQEVTGYHYVAADADVLMSTDWYYYDEFSVYYEEKEYTGGGGIFPVIQIHNLRLESFWPFRKKSPADEESHMWQLRLTENFVLPVSVGYRKTLPYRSEQKKYSEEEIQSLSQEHLKNYQEKLQEEKIQIEDVSVKSEISGDKCRTKGTMTVLEQAVERRPCEQRTVVPENGPEQE